jgi:hypothetical protein
MSTATQTSQQTSAPSSPNPKSPQQNQEIDSSAIIVDATPLSMVSPTSIKKKRSSRSKKKSSVATEETAITPPPSVEKSKKKKSKKPKIGSSMNVHTMESLHVDPIGDKPKESEKTEDQVQGDTAQTLEMFSKIAAKKITEEERHPMTQKIIDDVLREINDADVVPDVDTSLAQEEQGIEKDPEVEEAVVEKQVSNEEDPKDDTLLDKGEEAKDSEEEGSKASDKDADGDTNVVDVEEYDSDLPLSKVAEESIARRTRSGKERQRKEEECS